LSKVVPVNVKVQLSGIDRMFHLNRITIRARLGAIAHSSGLLDSTRVIGERIFLSRLFLVSAHCWVAAATTLRAYQKALELHQEARLPG